MRGEGLGEGERRGPASGRVGKAQTTNGGVGNRSHTTVLSKDIYSVHSAGAGTDETGKEEKKHLNNQRKNVDEERRDRKKKSEGEARESREQGREVEDNPDRHRRGGGGRGEELKSDCLQKIETAKERRR